MFTPFTLNIGGTLYEFSRPQVMGILNITPDSFYAQSRSFDVQSIKSMVECLVDNGADMIDVGAYSSRPGADNISEKEELRRIEMGMKAIRDINSDIIVSIDTFRANVARESITNLGANIINDISGGNLDDNMFQTIATMNVPYILMHMRGTPTSMSSLTGYDNVTVETIQDLSHKVKALSLLGVNDIIIDPGFGFAKTQQQNFELLQNLSSFKILGCPILVGISRKSMIYKSLGITPDNALNGTTVLNTLALTKGASILRVHDPREAREAIKLLQITYKIK